MCVLLVIVSIHITCECPRQLSNECFLEQREVPGPRHGRHVAVSWNMKFSCLWNSNSKEVKSLAFDAADIVQCHKTLHTCALVASAGAAAAAATWSTWLSAPQTLCSVTKHNILVRWWQQQRQQLQQSEVPGFRPPIGRSFKPLIPFTYSCGPSSHFHTLVVASNRLFLHLHTFGRSFKPLIPFT